MGGRTDFGMLNRFLYTSIAISLLFAPLAAQAQDSQDAQDEEAAGPDFARKGWCLGVAGTFITPLTANPGEDRFRIENPVVNGISLTDALFRRGVDLDSELTGRANLGVPRSESLRPFRALEGGLRHATLPLRIPPRASDGPWPRAIPRNDR